MKVNRKTVLSTAAVLGVAALIAGGTIAYFTDNESARNNFTIGNVDVTLYESQLHRVNANVGSYFHSNIADASADNLHICVPYLQNAVPTVNPYCTPNIAVGTDYAGVSAWQNGHVRAQNVTAQTGVYTDAQIIADANGTGQTGQTADYKYYDGIADGEASATVAAADGTYVADEYKNLVPGKRVRKFVYVKNTGNNSAYVRVKVTIPKEVANYVEVKAPHTPQETSTPTGNDNIKGEAMNYAYVTQSNNTATDGTVTMTFTFTDALKKDEMTYWSPITTVKLKDDLMESQITNINALRTTGFGINVDVDAIQSDGFATAEAAFQAFDGQTGSENEHNV